MLPGTKTYNKKEIKRKKIIESAAILFSQKNYHEVMIDEVAKMASVAKGTVYTYFSSKEELYFSIMRQRMEKLTSSLKENINFEISSIASLHSFVIHLYMFMIKYQNFFLMYRKETLNADNKLCSELLTLQNDLNNFLREIINQGKKENIFRNIDDDLAIDLILGSIYGGIARGIEQNISREQAVLERERIFNFILNGLFSGKNGALPLLNKTIVLTRTVEQSKESADILKQMGAYVIVFPTLDIVPPDSWEKFDEMVSGKNKIDFIILTSSHAVRMFKKRCEDLGVKINYDNLKVVAVGNKTAAVCENNSIPVHIIPKKFSADGVIVELVNYNLLGKTVFIPRSAIGREELPVGLEQMGAFIKTAPVYNVAIPSKEIIKKHLLELNSNKPDLFIFTSPSTFENFLQILNVRDTVKYFSGYDVAAIGPTTKSSIEDKGVEVNIVPEEYTFDGLVKAIVKYYK